MIASPYFWLGLLIALLVVFGSGYDLGAKHARNQAAADQLEAVEQARLDGIEQAKTDFKTAQRYEKARETVRTVYVKAKEKAHANIEKHPEYADCGLDADGLRIYNARPARAENPPGIPDGRMPGSSGSIGWQTLDDPDHQPGTLAALLRLPGAPQSAIGMGEHVTVGANNYLPLPGTETE